MNSYRTAAESTFEAQIYAADCTGASDMDVPPYGSTAYLGAAAVPLDLTTGPGIGIGISSQTTAPRVVRSQSARMALIYRGEIKFSVSDPRGAVDAELLRQNARSFEMSFHPYEGPDEPLSFEPDDFPVR